MARAAAGEVGEIVIRGHNVMNATGAGPRRRRGDPRGWFHSGDLARVDGDGYFFIVDRKKDMVIRGGYNVYPREIEEVLYEHEAVREAAVIGVRTGSSARRWPPRSSSCRAPASTRRRSSSS